MMKRREFITLLRGAAVAWPFVARAQGERMRRVGVLMSDRLDDTEARQRLAAFLQKLEQLGWTDGQNAQIHTHWGAGDAARIRSSAEQLATLARQQCSLASGSPAVAALQSAGPVPIVFVSVVDPVGAGFVESLARPGRNTTGFLLREYGMSGKWLEQLKEMVPSLTRAGVLRDPAIAGEIGQLAAIQAVAPLFRAEVTPLDVRDAGDIERLVSAFAHGSNGGLIVTGSPLAEVHRELIIRLAAKHRLPAVYPNRSFVAGGGLICYGPDVVEQYRQAAGYIDRILRGETPAELPVQAPTKYELVINLKTAKALGLEIPPTLLARADEVIE